MNFRFSSAQIHEIVQAAKVLVAGQSIVPEKKGKDGLRFQAFVELAEGSYLDLRYLGSAGLGKDPKTYEGGLL